MLTFFLPCFRVPIVSGPLMPQSYSLLQSHRYGLKHFLFKRKREKNPQTNQINQPKPTIKYTHIKTYCWWPRASEKLPVDISGRTGACCYVAKLNAVCLAPVEDLTWLRSLAHCLNVGPKREMKCRWPLVKHSRITDQLSFLAQRRFAIEITEGSNRLSPGEGGVEKRKPNSSCYRSKLMSIGRITWG